MSQISCLKQITFKREGLKSFQSYRLRAQNFFSLGLRIFSEFPFDAKNVSCSTSTKKTHMGHQLVHQTFSYRESCRSSLFPVGDAAVHCAQLSSPELPAACKCKTWQPLLVVQRTALNLVKRKGNISLQTKSCHKRRRKYWGLELQNGY